MTRLRSAMPQQVDAALEQRLINIESRLLRLEQQLGDKPAAQIEPESRIAWRHGLRPKFWSDVDVRRHIINRHRQITLSELRAEMLALFGTARTPSQSAIGRVWKRIDQTAAQRRKAAA